MVPVIFSQRAAYPGIALASKDSVTCVEPLPKSASSYDQVHFIKWHQVIFLFSSNATTVFLMRYGTLIFIAMENLAPKNNLSGPEIDF